MKPKKDFTNGDHSFRNWFKIMWSNKYIFIFLVALTAIIFEFIYLDDVIFMIKDNFFYSNVGGVASIILFSLPWIIISVVSYKGFYQFWKDLKNGRTR